MYWGRNQAEPLTLPSNRSLMRKSLLRRIQRMNLTRIFGNSPRRSWNSLSLNSLLAWHVDSLMVSCPHVVEWLHSISQRLASLLLMSLSDSLMGSRANSLSLRYPKISLCHVSLSSLRRCRSHRPCLLHSSRHLRHRSSWPPPSPLINYFLLACSDLPFLRPSRGGSQLHRLLGQSARP